MPSVFLDTTSSQMKHNRACEGLVASSLPQHRVQPAWPAPTMSSDA